jgi:hypothetical protein
MLLLSELINEKNDNYATDSLLSHGPGELTTFSIKIVNVRIRIGCLHLHTILTTGYGTAVNHESKFRFSFPKISVDSQVVISVLGYKTMFQLPQNLPREDSILLSLLRLWVLQIHWEFLMPVNLLKSP